MYRLAMLGKLNYYDAMSDIVPEEPRNLDRNETKPRGSSPHDTHLQASPPPPKDDPAEEIADVRGELAEFRTGQYKGAEGGYLRRGREAYEDEWNKSGGERITYDGLIASAIERGIHEGKKEVVIFDFGCGEGQAITEFLKDTDTQALAMIREHPEITVKFIGLTDTPGLSTEPSTAEELFAGRQLKTPDEDPRNLSAQIDYYAVSAAHPLEKYLVSHGITSIDIAMAVHSLYYLPSKNFDSVLRSITNRLQSPGSTLIAAPYATMAPGLKPNIVGQPMIDVRTKSIDASLPATLRDGGDRFYFPDSDIKEERENLEVALTRYEDWGALTPQEIDEEINRELPKTTKLINRVRRRRPQVGQVNARKSRQSLSNVAGALLTRGSIELGEQRLNLEREKKRNALNKLQSDYSVSAAVEYGENVIKITNTESIAA